MTETVFSGWKFAFLCFVIVCVSRCSAKGTALDTFWNHLQCWEENRSSRLWPCWRSLWIPKKSNIGNKKLLVLTEQTPSRDQSMLWKLEMHHVNWANEGCFAQEHVFLSILYWNSFLKTNSKKLFFSVEPAQLLCLILLLSSFLRIEIVVNSIFFFCSLVSQLKQPWAGFSPCVAVICLPWDNRCLQADFFAAWLSSNVDCSRRSICNSPHECCAESNHPHPTCPSGANSTTWYSRQVVGRSPRIGLKDFDSLSSSVLFSLVKVLFCFCSKRAFVDCTPTSFRLSARWVSKEKFI